MDSLDELFEQYLESGTSEERADLSQRYQELFYELSYDFACGKLNGAVGEWLLEIVEKIETLDAFVNWSLRAQAYWLAMEEAEASGDYLAVIHKGELAVDASLHQLKNTDEQKDIVYHRLANIYYTMVSYAIEDPTAYWNQSLHYIKAAILENPREANWAHYQKMVYGELLHETRVLLALRHEEKKIFRSWCLNLEKREGTLAYKIASQFVQFKELATPSSLGHFLFPEAEYLYWLNKSLEEELPELIGHELSSISHFYKKEGVRLQRVDLLQQALHYYRKMMDDEHAGSGFAVHYVTDALESIAQVYLKSGIQQMADDYMNEALLWNEIHQESIASNFSLQLHYAEFLERCYTYEGNIDKPTLSYIKEETLKAETLGEGYYSGPYFILARLAVLQKQEHAAATWLAHSLLLHEHNIQEAIENFQAQLKKDAYPYLETFLAANLLFMKETSANYYFSPKYTCQEIKRMTEDEVMAAWILRKGEIRNRAKII